MPAARVAEVVAQANALRPDLILLLGDLAGHDRFVSALVPIASIAGLLGGLWAPRVPSAYGNRYAYGLVREAGRSLVVSGGLGWPISLRARSWSARYIGAPA